MSNFSFKKFKSLPSATACPLIRLRRFFLGRPPQPESPRENQPVCVKCAATVQLPRSAANAVFEVHDLMDRRILHESIAAHNLLQPLSVSNPRHALEVSLLHAAIRMRYLGEAMPEIALVESAQRV